MMKKMAVTRRATNNVAKEKMVSVLETSTTKRSDNSRSSAHALVNKMMEDAGITSTTTKAGWCLRQGLEHVVTVDGGRLFELVKSQGPPYFYHSLKSCRHEPTDNIKAPETCFQSLCRIIAGQQLAGKAAQSIWKRLLETTEHGLTPSKVLSLAGDSAKDLEISLQKPAGLSRAKARAILDLAHHFESGQLSESQLSDPNATENDIRESLLKVKGLGPWSVDMFVMFYLEKPNIFPFGDLGVRKGVAKTFQLKGKGKQGSLCQKKDLERCQGMVSVYKPYQSLFTYYMWRAADIQEVYGGIKEEKDDKASQLHQAGTPIKRSGGRKRKLAVVTP